MSEAVGIVVRRHRSRVEADRLAVEFEQSGLTREAFCAQRGLPVRTLTRYCKQWRSETPAAASRILPVELISSGASSPLTEVSRGGLWVELGNGRRIAVAQGFDATTLERLVAVLEQA